MQTPNQAPKTEYKGQDTVKKARVIIVKILSIYWLVVGFLLPFIAMSAGIRGARNFNSNTFISTLVLSLSLFLFLVGAIVAFLIIIFLVLWLIEKVENL